MFTLTTKWRVELCPRDPGRTLGLTHQLQMHKPLHAKCNRLGADALGVRPLHALSVPPDVPQEGNTADVRDAGKVTRPEHAAVDADGRLRTSADGSPGRILNRPQVRAA